MERIMGNNLAELIAEQINTVFNVTKGEQHENN
jgi:hypothetical protein